MTTIGERIRDEREGRALTQGQLAQIAGMSTDGVFRIESGRTHPRPSNTRKLARALEVSVAQLTRGEIRASSGEPVGGLGVSEQVSDQGGSVEDELPRRTELLAMRARLDVLLGRKDILVQDPPSGLPCGTPPASRPEIKHERNTGAAVIDQRQ